MNRWLMAAVMGLTVVGCAVGVEDPQPAPGPDPTQKEPPAQPFSAELQAPDPNLAKVVVNNPPDLPPLPFDNNPPQPGE